MESRIVAINYYINRLKERLWVKPAVACTLSIIIVYLAHFSDVFQLADYLPQISVEVLETILEIMASSMLIMATLAVGAMVAAYASASDTATPRSLSLVVSDGSSQNALSIFVGAFIFSVIAIIALKAEYYDDAGRFTLFAATMAVFTAVILTFVRWVDSIARLGRVTNTIEKVEKATHRAILKNRNERGIKDPPDFNSFQITKPIYCSSVGYVKDVYLEELQSIAEGNNCFIYICAPPGSLVTEFEPIAYALDCEDQFDVDCIAKNILIGRNRVFDNDPRFGFIVLSEIGDRALSPAINDPGTAIDILDSLLKLLLSWDSPKSDNEAVYYSRLYIQGIDTADLLDDAFTSTIQYGCGKLEVALKLQKTLSILAKSENQDLKRLAKQYAQRALLRSEHDLVLEQDYQRVLDASICSPNKGNIKSQQTDC